MKDNLVNRAMLKTLILAVFLYVNIM